MIKWRAVFVFCKETTGQVWLSVEWSTVADTSYSTVTTDTLFVFISFRQTKLFRIYTQNEFHEFIIVFIHFQVEKNSERPAFQIIDRNII